MEFRFLPKKEKEYVIELGMKLYKLENENPITSDEMFTALQYVVEYVARTRLIDIRPLLFVKGNYDNPRSLYFHDKVYKNILNELLIRLEEGNRGSSEKFLNYAKKNKFWNELLEELEKI